MGQKWSSKQKNISVANCERLDKKYLKIVLELPENNFEKNFGKTKIVDRFINDLQDKLRKFKLTKTADSKDALKIIMKVRIVGLQLQNNLERLNHFIRCAARWPTR